MPTKIFELIAVNNPNKMISDYIPVWLKIFWKETILPIFLQPHHHQIIPLTPNHTSWTLGSQPTEKSIKKLYREEGTMEIRNQANNMPGKASRQKKIHIISMLTKTETIITDDNDLLTKKNGMISKIDKIPWLDHGTLNIITGKNQTIAAMINFQKSLYPEFEKTPPDTIFYCHCMAGKSRSFVETVAFLYFYPNKKKLFDFENWPKKTILKLKKKSPLLLAQLKDQPTIIDIAKFVKLQRPVVKKILNMEGDQAGLLGLLALNKNAGYENLDRIKKGDTELLYREAQNIGLMLKAPLDLGFRESADKKAQEEALLKVYSAYKERQINLLAAMLVPSNTKTMINPEKAFSENFAKLAPREQARFAILTKNLRGKILEKQPGIALEKPLDNPLLYAQIALTNAEKLTGGDQLELLKAFGKLSKLNYEYIMAKLLKGKAIDRYNVDIQLFELLHIIEKDQTQS